MPRVMISLVGEQPMPTVIPVVQYDVEHLHLVVSGRTAAVGRHIAEVLPHISISGQESPISPYQLQSLQAELSRRIRDHLSQGHEVWVNLTGGTKPMSLAAYRAAQDQGVPAIYVAMEMGSIIHYHPSGQEHTEPIQAYIDVPTYLQAHGLQVEEGRPPSPWREAVRFMAENARAGLEVLPAIATSVQKGFTDVGSLGISARVFARRLKEFGLLEVREGPTMLRVHARREAVEFLAGRWLEEYTADALRHSGLFDDVRMGVRITRVVNGTERVTNELDVVATRLGGLLVCSCKTSARDVSERQGRQGIIYELNSISRRELAGIFCHKAIITNRVNLAPAFLQRAKDSGIQVIDGDHLLAIPDLLAQHMTPAGIPSSYPEDHACCS